MLVVGGLVAAALAPAAPARARRAARPDAGLPRALAGDAGVAAALAPCAAPPAPLTLPALEPWARPSGERAAEAPWDGGTCEVSGRVTLLRAPAAPPPSGLVVFLEGVPPGLSPRQEPRRHQIRQRDRQFVPPLLVIQRHDTVDFWNDDQELHQVYSSDAEFFDIPSSTRSLSGSHRFRVVGSVRLQCDRHPLMRADVRIVDSPHWTLVRPDGSFELQAPAGRWTLVAWEPNGGRAERLISACEEPAQALTLQQAPQPVRRRRGGAMTPNYSQ